MRISEIHLAEHCLEGLAGANLHGVVREALMSGCLESDLSRGALQEGLSQKKLACKLLELVSVVSNESLDNGWVGRWFEISGWEGVKVRSKRGQKFP